VRDDDRKVLEATCANRLDWQVVLNSPINETANIPIISAHNSRFEDESDWHLLLFATIATLWQNHNMPVFLSSPKPAIRFVR
jgi:hypothetical protein